MPRIQSVIIQWAFLSAFVITGDGNVHLNHSQFQQFTIIYYKMLDTNSMIRYNICIIQINKSVATGDIL